MQYYKVENFDKQDDVLFDPVDEVVEKHLKVLSLPNLSKSNDDVVEMPEKNDDSKIFRKSQLIMRSNQNLYNFQNVLKILNF